uniref:(northern house mosquito) hypothetical protein n=1 Tax=Culex pipiens TaxID=7175 RepID=A0A8D8CE64_CULPI
MLPVETGRTVTSISDLPTRSTVCASGHATEYQRFHGDLLQDLHRREHSAAPGSNRLPDSVRSARLRADRAMPVHGDPVAARRARQVRRSERVHGGVLDRAGDHHDADVRHRVRRAEEARQRGHR